jgi:hypothetical protein
MGGAWGVSDYLRASMTPLPWRHALMTFKNRRKVCLRLKSDGKSDIHDGIAGFLEKLFCAIHSLSDQVVVRTHTRGDLELCREVHGRQACRASHICQGHLAIEPFRNEIHNALEPPRRERTLFAGGPNDFSV